MGIPINAVIIPTGNCIGLITVRAIVSANTRRDPPEKTDTGRRVR